MIHRTLTRRQVREVDRRAVDEYGMSSLVLMENAGRGVVDVLQRLGIDGPVVIACGKGNNAGDGFVVARHLEIRGCSARIVLWADPSELTGDARANFEILEKTSVPIQSAVAGSSANSLGAKSNVAGTFDGADWIVDALLGTGARGEPRPPFDEAIDLLNARSAKRLALDVPSGLDCDTGQVAQHTFRADHTCTFVARKPGFDVGGAAEYTGTIHVLDIGVPPKLVKEVANSEV